MVCKNCGTKFESNFCPHCGAPAPSPEPQMELCPGCGAPLENGVCPLCEKKARVALPLMTSERFWSGLAIVVKAVPLLAWYGFWAYVSSRATKNLWIPHGMLILPVLLAVLSWATCAIQQEPFRFFASVKWLGFAGILASFFTVGLFLTVGFLKEHSWWLNLLAYLAFWLICWGILRKGFHITWNTAKRIPMCPRCYSTNLRRDVDTSHIGIKQGSFIVMEPVDRVVMTCCRCGKRWKARR